MPIPEKAVILLEDPPLLMMAREARPAGVTDSVSRRKDKEEEEEEARPNHELKSNICMHLVRLKARILTSIDSRDGIVTTVPQGRTSLPPPSPGLCVEHVIKARCSHMRNVQRMQGDSVCSEHQEMPAWACHQLAKSHSRMPLKRSRACPLSPRKVRRKYAVLVLP